MNLARVRPAPLQTIELCDVVFKYALGNGSQGQHLLLSMQRATGFLYGGCLNSERGNRRAVLGPKSATLAAVTVAAPLRQLLQDIHKRF
jgi:hypothetical protein